MVRSVRSSRNAGNVVKKIHADVDAVLDSKATQEFFREQSLNRVDLSAEGMRQLMERDSAHWGKLIKSLASSWTKRTEAARIKCAAKPERFS